MAHPIAGPGQFPFQINGFLVDSAKIDGRTFSKELYIHKQSSSFMFDLIEATTGEIFKDVRITWYDENNIRLRYDDSSLFIASILPERTFARKVQSVPRNIYGFLVMIHENKVKVSTGDYIFYDIDKPQELNGVTLVPQSITVKQGQQARFMVKFFPNDYPYRDGNWSAKDSRIARSTGVMDGSMITFDAMEIGSTTIAFTPNGNDMLTATGYITVEPNHPGDQLDKIIVSPLLPVRSNPRPVEANAVGVFAGQEVSYRVVYIPTDYIPREPATLEYDRDVLEFVEVSRDLGTYKFKVRDNQTEAKDFSINFKVLSNGIEYTAMNSGKILANDEANIELNLPAGCRIDQTIYAQAICSDESLTWESTDPTVLEITGPGECLGKKEGTVQVYATTPGGGKSVMTVTVSDIHAEFVTISKPCSGIYDNGDTDELIMVVNPPECAEFYVPYWNYTKDTPVNITTTVTPTSAIGSLVVDDEPKFKDGVIKEARLDMFISRPPIAGRQSNHTISAYRRYGTSSVESKYLIPTTEQCVVQVGHTVILAVDIAEMLPNEEYHFEVEFEGTFDAVRPYDGNLSPFIQNGIYEISGTRPGIGKITFTVAGKPDIHPLTIPIIVFG